MLRLKVQSGEDKAAYCIRVAHIAKSTLARCNHEKWDSHYHRLVFLWGGHVQRMKIYDPTRLTYRILNYKNWAWIQDIAGKNNGNQLHNRKVHVWRWERPLYKYFEQRSRTWQEEAMDKNSWHKLLDSMVAWRCLHR